MGGQGEELEKYLQPFRRDRQLVDLVCCKRVTLVLVFPQRGGGLIVRSRFDARLYEH